MEHSAVDYAQETVLVVDDEEHVRTPVVEMLKTLGFSAKSAENATHALDLIGSDPPDGFTFVLTDIKMTSMSGLEFIETLRSDYPHIQSIAMTGYSHEYGYMDVINAGAVDFIDKPFGLEELEAKLKRAIRERNTRDLLSRLSVTDSLTGLYNQRHFYTRLREEITRATRQGSGVAILMIDLDNFKHYNDTYGHLAGDEILRKVGEITRANIRQGVDTGYRYGGDEFSVIVVDASGEVGRAIGVRIVEAIEKQGGVSASFGYAEHSDEMSAEELVDHADRELYRIKRAKNHRSGSAAQNV